MCSININYNMQQHIFQLSNFTMHFLKNVVRVNALGPPRSLKLWLGKQVHDPCKIHLLQQVLFV